MLTINDHLKIRLKNLVYARIREDFPDDYPANVKRIGREEENCADIRYLYGETFSKVYKMIKEIKLTIENSRDPYEDPAVHNVLEKYCYFISPSGRHIYGAGPRF